MKAILSERNLVLILFVLVIIIFSFAQEDSKKMEKEHMEINLYTKENFTLLEQKNIESSSPIKSNHENASDKKE